MDDTDFINALRGSAEKEKTAGFMDLLKQHRSEIQAGALGAGVLSAGQYLMNRRVRGKPSTEQVVSAAFADSAEAMKDRAERDNRPLTFREDITSAVAPFSKNLADVLTRHPVKGALLVAPAGALAGLRILKALSRRTT